MIRDNGAMDSRRSLSLRLSFLGIAVLVLAACTSTRPIPIAPSKPLVRALESERDQSEIETTDATTREPTIVAVCYNGLVNDDAEILAAALLSCPAGRLTLREDDYFWTRCPLLQPERANFVCVPEDLPKQFTPAQ